MTQLKKHMIDVETQTLMNLYINILWHKAIKLLQNKVHSFRLLDG